MLDQYQEFFEGFEAKISFFVKNSVHLDLPSLEKCYPTARYEIVRVSEEDDDDFALLTEAKNEDGFIISLDRYKTYQTKNIISAQWLQDHRIPVTYKK
jgi:hypothetical protein